MDNKPVRTLCLGILVEGRHRFNAMLGIVSRIRGETYEIFAVSTDTKIPEVGDAYMLNAVYCREVFQKRRTVAITEVDGVSGMRLHPLYGRIPCELYISAPIMVAGKVWGTLNFTSLDKRDTPFTADDIAFIEARATRIAAAVAEAGMG